MDLNKTRKHSLFFAFIIGLIVFSILTFFEFLTFEKYESIKKAEISNTYIEVSSTLDYIISDNINILNGLYAYLEIVPTLEKDNIYLFLETLLKGTKTYIRNIVILKGTTITWNYPEEDNTSSLGVDLATIDSQKESVLFVKNTSYFDFIGPINLVQGGRGYIIRKAFNRDEKYYGQISLVLNADEIENILINLENKYNMNIQITSKYSTIFSKDYVSNYKDLSYMLNKDIIQWKVNIQPKDKWKVHYIWFTLIPFIFLLISFVFSYMYYNMNIASINTKHKADHDHLTNLYNRGPLNKHFNKILNIANINKLQLGLIILDINDFKLVNDNYGHVVGDKVLINFANDLKTSLRLHQTAYRIGGDEFLVLIENLDSFTILKEVTERIQKSVFSTLNVNGDVITVTSSVGCSSFPIDGSNLDELFATADKRMYDNKEIYKKNKNSL